MTLVVGTPHDFESNLSDFPGSNQPLPGAMDEWTELDTGVPTKVALHLIHEGDGVIDQQRMPVGSSAIGLVVDDIHTLHDRMITCGATVVCSPKKQSW